MNRIQTFLLLLICWASLGAQNSADGFFVNPSVTTTAPSVFGPQDLYVYECGEDIIFDGSPSMGEDAYFVELSEFDLSTWNNVEVFHSDWVCAPVCSAPNNIDVLSFFGGESPQCGTIYKFRLATGPVWATIDRFFAIDCGNNGVPTVKTFDVFHRLQEDTMLDLLDLGTDGIIKQNGDYASIGATLQENSGEVRFATALYDQSGNVSAPPAMGVLPTYTNWGIVGAEEILSGGAHDGYLSVINENDNDGITFIRLDPTGTILWGDDITLFLNGTYPATPNDFIIDGDRAVVTGHTVIGNFTYPFILIYDYVLRSVVCTEIFQLSPASNTFSSGQAIVNNTNTGHYAIAGRTGQELFYLEVEYDCGYFLNNQSQFYPMDADPATFPLAKEILFDPSSGNPIICGRMDGGAIDQLFVQYNNNTMLAQLDGSIAMELTAAVYNQQDEVILAGRITNNDGNQGFIAAADYESAVNNTNFINWAKKYNDGQYPETVINDLDLDTDGGYYTVGYGIRQNTTNPPFDFDFEFFDTWIMKTDAEGVLMNCNCYEEIPWEEGLFVGSGELQLSSFTPEINPTYLPYETQPLQETDYFCDQWCPPPPPECQIAVSATPTADTTDLCCYDLSFFIDPVHLNEFTEIQITPGIGSQLTPLTSLPVNYSLVQNTSTQISLISNSGNLCPGTFDRYFPTGTLPSVELCVADFTGNMPVVNVDFLKCDGEICSDSLTLACNPCIEIVNDTIVCDGDQYKYLFDFQNTWNQPISRLAVNNIATLPATLTPDTLYFTPPIPVGSYAGQQSICISTGVPMDSVKFDFKALGDDDCCFCISDLICQPLPFCCDTCESIDYIVTDTIIGDGQCCYSLDIYHCTDSLFTALRVSTLGNVTLSSQSAGTNWSMLIPGASSNTSQTYFPRPVPIHGTPIPTGWSNAKVNFCLGNINSPADVPQNVVLEWLAGSDTNIICQDTLIFDCLPPGPDTNCVALADTLWDCISPGIYQLDLDLEIKRPGTTYAAWITNYHSMPAGAQITPSPTLLQGNWSQGTIISMPTITVANVSPGDSICFVLALSDTIVTGQYVNTCCYSDTICLVVPPCDVTAMGYDCDTLGLPVYEHDYLGWAGVTCFSGFNVANDPSSGIDGDGYVMGLLDVQPNGSAPLGSNWAPTMKHDPAFTADSLGQIFGMAVDENACIYVTATSLYGNPSTQTAFNWGSAGPGGIYQLCPDAAGDYQKTNELSLPNVESGLGQVTYDPIHRQLFVSNFHDGLIYRIDVTSWTLNNTYDFPGYATGSATLRPDFVALGDRVWAVEYNIFENRLYFAVWGEDQRNMFDAASTNQLWRIDLDATGDFSGPAGYVLDLPGRDYNGSQVSTHTAPISDLAFSKEGRMLVSERSLRDDYVDQPFVNWPGHASRMYSYELAGGNWVNPRLHYIGRALAPYGDDNANSSGGCDFGYLDNLSGCDSMVWTTGDLLSNTSLIYGLQAHQWPGNSNVPSDPDYLQTNSIFIDLDGNLTQGAKVQQGDVEIFRSPCCSPPLQEPTCCEDEEAFRDAVQNGFQIVFNGNTATVSNPLLDSCNVLDIDWGDGSFDQVLATNLPISHTYLNPVSNDLCILVTEIGDEGNICWEEFYCTPIEPSDPGCEACPDTLTWTVLDNSPTSAYYELHNYQGQLYIVNYFGTVNGIARFDGTSWTAIAPSSFDADFERLFEHQGDLWATVAIRNIATGQVVDYDLAKWDEITLDWTRQFLDLEIIAFSDFGRIYAATSYGNQIAIGGYFDDINGTTPANNFAVWDPVTNTWNTLNATFDEQVTALGVYNSELIVGGGFQTPHNQISRYDGSTWQALGGGLSPHASMPISNRRISALTEINGLLYVGGRFSEAVNGGPVSGTRGIAIWDGTNWSSFGGGITSSFIYHQANNFKEVAGDIYVAGYYGDIGGQPITGLAKFDGSGFVNTGLGAQLEVYDLECLANEDGFCEIYCGAEQLFGKLSCDSVTATREVSIAPLDLTLSPNPTNGAINLQLELQRSGDYQLDLFDLHGRRVYHEQVALPGGPNIYSLNLSELPDGQYVLRFTGQGTQAIRRLVKLR